MRTAAGALAPATPVQVRDVPNEAGYADEPVAP